MAECTYCNGHGIVDKNGNPPGSPALQGALRECPECEGSGRKVIMCLWCGKSFEWDPGMYRFCDDCMRKIELVEEHLCKRVIVQELEDLLKGQDDAEK